MKNEIMKRRLEMGLTRKQLEELTGVSHTVIKALEYGARSTDKAQINTLVAICVVLGCRISDVLTDPELIAALRICEQAESETVVEKV